MIVVSGFPSGVHGTQSQKPINTSFLSTTACQCFGQR